MKRTKPKPHRRLKAGATALVSLGVGLGLLVVSRIVSPPGKPGLPAPTTAPAPAPGPAPAKPPAPGRPAALNMSGLLLLLSLVFFAVTLVSVGWIVFDVRRCRPAWKTQKKYPRKR